jgi:hypothetical protein
MTIEEVFASRNAFNDYVYTPWEEALETLDRRAEDTELQAYVDQIIPQGLPPVMRGRKSMVLFRHIATPTYETNRFFIAADALGDRLQPLVLEYLADKFNNRSDGKYFLGKIPFYRGRNGKGESLIEFNTIIDFNASNNKPINSVNTHWGQSLVDFHHELFDQALPDFANARFDLSEWLHAVGPAAHNYYKSFLTLFLKDALLFENFFIDSSQKEFSFNRDIILPAFKEICEESGVRPLIVALEPTHMECDPFWNAHPESRKELIDRKRAGAIPQAL